MNQQLPPAVQWAQQQLGQFGRVGATRLLIVPALAAVIAAGVGNLGQAPLLTFREPGTVIALYGQERTGTTAKFAKTDVRVQFGGDIDLISNGTSGDFAPLLALVGPNVNWFPLTRRVREGENWTITWRNQDAAATCDPSMVFAFIADADLAKMK